MTTANYITNAAKTIVLADDVKAKYSAAGGNGNDAFGYRRGSGASALCYVFALNAEFNANEAQSRPALEAALCAIIETNIWPGKPRGGCAPALASMSGRSFVEQHNGGWRLSEKGLNAGRIMLADMGVEAPAEDDTTEPKAPSKPKTKRNSRKKGRKSQPGDVLQPGETLAVLDDGSVTIAAVTVDEPTNENANENANEFSLQTEDENASK